MSKKSSLCVFLIFLVNPVDLQNNGEMIFSELSHLISLSDNILLYDCSSIVQICLP